MKKIIFLTLFIPLFISLFFLGGCNDLPIKKGKKGDFTFRKCTNCEIKD